MMPKEGARQDTAPVSADDARLVFAPGPAAPGPAAPGTRIRGAGVAFRCRWDRVRPDALDEGRGHGSWKVVSLGSAAVRAGGV